MGFLSSIVGGLYQNQAVSDTNLANFGIAQMNNSFNERMLQKQMDYNMAMWNAQNAYNTPAAQMQRFKDAGVNPYMALGNIQSGQAGSAGGVNPPTATPVTMQPGDYSFIDNAVQSTISNAMQYQMNQSSIAKQDAETNQINIENQYRGMKLIEEIEQMRANTENRKLQNDFQAFQNSVMGEIYSSDMLIKRRQAESLEAGTRAQLVRTSIDELHKLNLPKQYELTFASMAASILETQARTEHEWASVYTELEKGFKETAQAYNIRLNNAVLESTLNDLIDEAKANARQAGVAADFEGINQVTGVVGNLINGYTQFKGTRPSKKHTYGYNRGKYYDVWEVNY